MTIHPRSVLVPYPHEPQSESDERSGSHRGCGAQQSNPRIASRQDILAPAGHGPSTDPQAQRRGRPRRSQCTENRRADGFCGCELSPGMVAIECRYLSHSDDDKNQSQRSRLSRAASTNRRAAASLNPPPWSTLFEKEAGHRTLGQKNKSRRRNQALLGIAFQIGQIVQQLPVTVAPSSSSTTLDRACVGVRCRRRRGTKYSLAQAQNRSLLVQDVREIPAPIMGRVEELLVAAVDLSGQEADAPPSRTHRRRSLLPSVQGMVGVEDQMRPEGTRQQLELGIKLAGDFRLNRVAADPAASSPVTSLYRLGSLVEPRGD